MIDGPITDQVYRLAVLRQQRKEIEAKEKDLKKSVKEYMKKNNLTELSGLNNSLAKMETVERKAMTLKAMSYSKLTTVFDDKSE